MKRTFSGTFWVVVLLAFVLLARLVDIVAFCDPVTGYLTGGSWLLRAVSAAMIVVFFAAVYRVYKKRVSSPGGPEAAGPAERPVSVEPNGGIALLFLLGGVSVIVYSVYLYYQLGIPNAFSLLFLGKEALLARGQANSLFKYDLILCALGLFAALWFIFSAAWYAKGRGRFLGGRFYSIVVILWFFMRVVRQFFGRSINHHNTLAVAATFAVAVLAVFFTKYAKYISLDFLPDELPGLMSWGIVSFIVIVGFHAPGLVSYIQVLLNRFDPGFFVSAGGAALSAALAQQKSIFGIVEIGCNLLCALLALRLSIAFEPNKQPQKKEAGER